MTGGSGEEGSEVGDSGDGACKEEGAFGTAAVEVVEVAAAEVAADRAAEAAAASPARVWRASGSAQAESSNAIADKPTRTSAAPEMPQRAWRPGRWSARGREKMCSIAVGPILSRDSSAPSLAAGR